MHQSVYLALEGWYSVETQSMYSEGFAWMDKIQDRWHFSQRLFEKSDEI